jgi:Secretion system C-terminal sorting domain/FG-GAP repeat
MTYRNYSKHNSMLTVIDIERHYKNSADKVVPLSLSSDGTVVAIGAYQNNGNGSDAGHVRIYENVAGTWIKIGNDIDGEAAEDKSGHSVSLSSDGSVVAIGANWNDGNGTYAGHVRIYEDIAGTWTQIGSDIDGEAAEDFSGTSVSLSSDGSIVAIGANANDGNGSKAGHVRIYENIANTWTQIGSDIDGEAADDYLGFSVSLSSDASVVAIGAYQNDGNGSDAGHVRIYENIAGTWTQIGSEIDGEAIDDRSGYSVSLSSDSSVVAIGAIWNDGHGSKAGHVRIYSYCKNSYDTIYAVACDTFTSPSGNYIWTTSGTYMDIIPNAIGCDSIITINLSINNTTASYTNTTACDSMIWYGTTYYSSGLLSHTLSITNAAGCDSLVSLGLTVNHSNTGDTIAVVCGSMMWYGTTYYSSAMPTHTFTNVEGCDSVVTLDLTINTVDVSVTQNGNTLTANLAGASYQWVDCDNSYAIISGETMQSFTPAVIGNYAVIIDDGICIDTSICSIYIGIKEQDNNVSLFIYPNPTTGKITIECENMERVEVVDITGKLVYEQLVLNDVLDIDISGFSKGVYFVKVSTADGVGVERIVLE